MFNTVVLVNSIYIVFFPLEKFVEIIVKRLLYLLSKTLKKLFLRLNSKIN